MRLHLLIKTLFYIKCFINKYSNIVHYLIKIKLKIIKIKRIYLINIKLIKNNNLIHIKIIYKIIIY
jgi:hypothetical protein